MSAAGWYVVVQDGARMAPVLGPLATQAGAESYLDNVRAMLREMGGRAHFMTPGVARYERKST